MKSWIYPYFLLFFLITTCHSFHFEALLILLSLKHWFLILILTDTIPPSWFKSPFLTQINQTCTFKLLKEIICDMAWSTSFVPSIISTFSLYSGIFIYALFNYNLLEGKDMIFKGPRIVSHRLFTRDNYWISTFINKYSYIDTKNEFISLLFFNYSFQQFPLQFLFSTADRPVLPTTTFLLPLFLTNRCTQSGNIHN